MTEGSEYGVIVRPMLPSDRAYVTNSWIKSYRIPSMIPTTVYRAHYPGIVETCIDCAETLVIAHEQTPTLIVAWACGQSDMRVPTLHYAYVRDGARRLGLAHRLVSDLFGGVPDRVDCTARVPFDSARYVYNPFAMGLAL